MISNVSLDEINVGEIMTPRTVVMVLEQQTVKVFGPIRIISPLPESVYQDNIDSITGVVRRRIAICDCCRSARAQSIEFQQKATFVPQVGLLLVLKTLQSSNQQLVVVVDEFGSTVGVVAMEDIFEHILGGKFLKRTTQPKICVNLLVKNLMPRLVIPLENDFNSCSAVGSLGP